MFRRSAARCLLSHSALKSPQLLELSGIGRKDVLEKIGVPLRVELPGVGENVQEHVFAQLSWGAYIGGHFNCSIVLKPILELKEEVEFDTLDLLRDPVLAAKHLELQWVSCLWS